MFFSARDWVLLLGLLSVLFLVSGGGLHGVHAFNNCSAIRRCSECVYDQTDGIMPPSLMCAWCESTQTCKEVNQTVLSYYRAASPTSSYGGGGERGGGDAMGPAHTPQEIEAFRAGFCEDLREPNFNPVCADMSCIASYTTNNIYICRAPSLLTLVLAFLLLALSLLLYLWLLTIWQLPWKYEPFVSDLLEGRLEGSPPATEARPREEELKRVSSGATSAALHHSAIARDCVSGGGALVSFRANPDDAAMEARAREVVAGDDSLSSPHATLSTTSVLLRPPYSRTTPATAVTGCCPICKCRYPTCLGPGEVCFWCDVARFAFVPFSVALLSSVIVIVSDVALSLKPWFADWYYTWILILAYAACVGLGWWVMGPPRQTLLLYSVSEEVRGTGRPATPLVCTDFSSPLSPDLPAARSSKSFSTAASPMMSSSFRLPRHQRLQLLNDARRNMASTTYMRLALRLRGRSLLTELPKLAEYRSQLQLMHAVAPPVPLQANQIGTAMRTPMTVGSTFNVAGVDTAAAASSINMPEGVSPPSPKQAAAPPIQGLRSAAWRAGMVTGISTPTIPALPPRFARQKRGETAQLLTSDFLSPQYRKALTSTLYRDEFIVWHSKPELQGVLMQNEWLLLDLVAGLLFGVWLLMLSSVSDESYAIVKLSGSTGVAACGLAVVLGFTLLLVVVVRGCRRLNVLTNERLLTVYQSIIEPVVTTTDLSSVRFATLNGYHVSWFRKPVLEFSWEVPASERKMPVIQSHKFSGIVNLREFLYYFHMMAPQTPFHLQHISQSSRNDRIEWRLHVVLCIGILVVLPILTLYPHAVPDVLAAYLFVVLLLVIFSTILRGVRAQQMTCASLNSVSWWARDETPEAMAGEQEAGAARRPLPPPTASSPMLDVGNVDGSSPASVPSTVMRTAAVLLHGSGNLPSSTSALLPTTLDVEEGGRRGRATTDTIDNNAAGALITSENCVHTDGASADIALAPFQTTLGPGAAVAPGAEERSSHRCSPRSGARRRVAPAPFPNLTSDAMPPSAAGEEKDSHSATSSAERSVNDAGELPTQQRVYPKGTERGAVSSSSSRISPSGRRSPHREMMSPADTGFLVWTPTGTSSASYTAATITAAARHAQRRSLSQDSNRTSSSSTASSTPRRNPQTPFPSFSSGQPAPLRRNIPRSQTSSVEHVSGTDGLHQGSSLHASDQEKPH